MGMSSLFYLKISSTSAADLFLHAGCKQNNVGIVYTMASNLKKTSHMEIGQVGALGNKSTVA
eukprot:scaffold250238_cov14-Tisochrysis_lutea.AAC.1